jgi:hypothetical protein
LEGHPSWHWVPAGGFGGFVSFVSSEFAITAETQGRGGSPQAADSVNPL